MNLTTATPVDIDTELAELHGRFTIALTRVTMNQEAARKAKLRGHEDQAARHEVMVAEYTADAQDIAATMRPLEVEFNRRGGWTRAFVVAEGHVHRSMDCSTCNNGMYPTEFGWVTEFSGKTEAEVIEAAGSRACTVCYPSAPVDAQPGRIFHASEIEAQKARDERAAKKAAADAKKAANAFGPYPGPHGKLETVNQAKTFLTDGFDWGWGHPSYKPEDRDTVAAMLGEKLGTSPQEQLQAADKRARNRS